MNINHLPGVFGKNSPSFRRFVVEALEARTLMSVGALTAVSSGGGASTPSIAMASDGRFVVAYTQANANGSGPGIMARIYNSDASPAGAPFAVDPVTGGDQIGAQVAADAAGDFVVTWDDVNAGTIDAQRFNNLGVAQGGQITVATLDTLTLSQTPSQTPSVGMDGSGNFVVDWISWYYEYGSNNERSFFQKFDSTGAPVGGVVDFGVGGPSSVAMNAQGNYVVAVAEQGGVFSREYNSGGTVLGQTTWWSLDSVNVALDNTGEYRAATTYGSAATALFAQVPGVNSMTQTQVGDGTGVAPAIAVDQATGASIVAFVGGSSVDVQYFNADASIATDSWKIHSLAGSVTGGPAIAMTDPHDAVVVWVDSTDGNVVAVPLFGTMSTMVSSITPDMTRASFSTSVTWKVTFADAVSGVSASNFQLAAGTLGGSPAITSVVPLDGRASTDWEVTASTGTGGGTLGLNFVNSAGIGDPVVVTNTLTGGIYTFPSPQALILTSTFSSLTLPTITAGDSSDIITGSLAAGGYIPTGNVTVSLGGTNVSATIATNGTFAASLNTAALGAGSYPVQVSYEGDSAADAATATPFLTVTPVATSFTNLPSLMITDGAASATFTGVVAAATGTPTGSVLVTLDGNQQSSPIGSDGSVTVTFSTALLALGSHQVQYAYSANGDFSAASAGGTAVVGYNVTARAPQHHVRRKTFPITVQLATASGIRVASEHVDVTAVGIAPTSLPGQITPMSTFAISAKFRRTGHFYTYQLRIPSSTAAGSYLLFFTVAGDPTIHSVQFTV